MKQTPDLLHFRGHLVFKTAIFLGLLCASVGCTAPKQPGGVSVNITDADGDGFNNIDDCDDSNPLIHPQAVEVCDDIDNDCDGEIDVDAVDAMLGYFDGDGDGFGDSEQASSVCTFSGSMVGLDNDCDDSNSEVFPGSVEICDELDNDCDALVDDDDPNILQSTQQTFFLDGDGDGYGAPPTAYLACEPLQNSVSVGGDCNDAAPGIYPDALEICDGLDNDCDGLIDISDPDAEANWYADQDGDGFGTSENIQRSCTQPPGYVSSGTDCDDGNVMINPEALEVCDGTDNDCDGFFDDDDDSLDASTTGIAHYQDVDGDGYGAPNGVDYSCVVPSDRVTAVGDCNDADVNIYPTALEVCDDGIDNNCNQANDCADSDCSSDGACSELNCTDGIDDDGDGPWDCLDSDCFGSGDCGEQQCADGADNDGDGYTDCDDSQCFLNTNCAIPACPNFDLLSAMGNNILFGDTQNAINSVDPACGSYYGTAPDYTVSWTAPADGCASFDTLNSSYDTVLAVYSSCADMNDPVGYLGGGCNDQANNTNQSQLFCNVTQGSDYFMVIDGWEDDDIGQYGFSVSMQVGVSCNCSSTCCTN